ncbi:MAG: hypothetical protein DRN57_01540 [Thermoplasmata archaeon]|nr:MAG: hypothetical protein DRN57_01540 [Thermoplasmata archaeon]
MARSGRLYEKETRDEESEEAKRAHPILIVAVTLVVLILVGAIIYFLLGSGDLNSVVVGNVEKGADGISFPIYTSVDGAGEYDGEIIIEIFYQDLEEPVYHGTASIKDDSGFHTVAYDDFVWGNGEYEIHARHGGIEDFIPMRIDSVADRITPSWSGQNMDLSRMTHDYHVEVRIGYMFGERSYPDPEDPQLYSFKGTLSGPDGNKVDIDSHDYPANLLVLSRTINHTVKGTYMLVGSVTNVFCHPDSPFRTVQVVENSTFSFDAPPFAVLGDDLELTLEGGYATAELDASGSWDDSGIESYVWYISGDADDTITTNNPTLEYQFTSTGTYYISLEVRDDSGNISEQNAEISTMTVHVS